MAKKSMIARDVKRAKIVAKYAVRRDELKKKIKDPAVGYEERYEATLALQKLPRNASPCRQRSRCTLTGRSRGYYRKFRLSRSKLRELMLQGEVPGVVKASW